MKNYLLLFLLLAQTFAGYAEDLPKFKFGKVSMDEMNIQKCEIDTGAHAFYLFDTGTTDFSYNQDKGFRIEFRRHCRIKIISKAGYEYAEFKIPYYDPEFSNREESVSNIKAATYNLENGKIAVTKLDKSAIFVEKESKNWYYKSFTLPNVKEGSVLEVEYVVYSDFLWNLPKWYFQRSIPIKWSIAEINIPEYFHYNKEMRGYISLFKREESVLRKSITLTSVDREVTKTGNNTQMNTNSIYYNQNSMLLASKDVPAFKEEPYLDAASNYLSSITFELASVKYPSQVGENYTTTWEEICKKLKDDDDFGTKLSANQYAKDKIKELNLDGLSDTEKALAIFNYTKKSTKWDETVSIYSGGIRDLMKTGVGSSGDINMMLINLLDAAKLNVRPVVLKTRASGMLPFTYPSLSALNYLIAAVRLDSALVLLDATEDVIPFNFLPERCMNGKGILINSDNTIEWIEMNRNCFSKYLSMGEFAFDETGGIEGQMIQRRQGHDAIDRRLELDVEKEKIVEELEKDNEGLTVEEYSNENLDEPEKPIVETYTALINNNATIAGGRIYFNPCLFDKYKENPFKIEDRQYPVDFAYKWENKATFTYKLPEGWAIESVPEEMKIGLENNAGYFRYGITILNNSITFNQILKVDAPVILPANYKGLKEFFRMVVEKQKEQIVLKKI